MKFLRFINKAFFSPWDIFVMVVAFSTGVWWQALIVAVLGLIISAAVNLYLQGKQKK